MATGRTNLLDLPLPTEGELDGTWGDMVNYGLTEYLDIAIAGRTALTSANFTAGALTITTTEGDTAATNIVASSAQYATLYTSSLATNSTITAPSSNRAYRVINADSTYTLTVKASGQTGITFQPGQSGIVAFNGTDYALVGTIGPTVPVARGGTGATTLTANNVILGNGTSAVQFVAPGSSGNILTSNGTTWTSAAAGATLSGVTDSGSPYETSLGYQAGNVTTGINNTFVGYQAGLVNSTGTDNTAVGYRALDANTTGTANVAIGVNALGSNTTAPNNIAIGNSALVSGTTGQQNVAIGTGSAQSLTTGSGNTALGDGALLSITTQSGSTAIGRSALYSDTGGSNTALGRLAGYAVTTGTQNILIGHGAGNSGTNNLTTGSNNILIGYNAAASSASVSNEVTIGNTSITSTRLRGMVQLNAAMFEQATVSATAATGTINYDTRTQSVLYYTSNASGNWTLNIRGASGVSLDSIMSTGQSITVAFLVTNGATAYYQSAFQVDGSSVTPKWQGGTAPTAGNASSIDAYVITVIKTGSATFTALASQTKFA